MLVIEAQGWSVLLALRWHCSTAQKCRYACGPACQPACLPALPPACSKLADGTCLLLHPCFYMVLLPMLPLQYWATWKLW